MMENTFALNTWTLEQCQEAKRFYRAELLKPHDDVEHNWFLRSIDRCNRRISDLTNTHSEWESLFK